MARERTRRRISTRLCGKRHSEEALCDSRAAAEWRLSLELFQHELLDWVVKDAIAHPDAGFARASWAVGKPDARGKCPIVGLRQARRNAFVSWYHQAHG